MALDAVGGVLVERHVGFRFVLIAHSRMCLSGCVVVKVYGLSIISVSSLPPGVPCTTATTLAVKENGAWLWLAMCCLASSIVSNWRGAGF
jgi:hypothetical protein